MCQGRGSPIPTQNIGRNSAAKTAQIENMTLGAKLDLNRNKAYFSFELYEVT